MKTWKEHTGRAPYALADLGTSPRLYNEAWWMRRDGVIYSAPAGEPIGFGAVMGGRRPVLNDIAMNQIGLGALDPPTPTSSIPPVTAAESATATAMANALNAHGYKLADTQIYKAFQSAEGLTPDGYPGPTTMTYLKDVLFAMGVDMPNVKVYPWSAANGKYDGVNAPPMSEWNPGGGGGGSNGGMANPSTNTTTNNASMFSTESIGVGAAVLAGLALVAVAVHKPTRGAAKGHYKRAKGHLFRAHSRAKGFARRHA